MQPLTLLFAMLFALAVPADKPAAPALDIDAMIEEVSAWEPAKQQEWLRRLRVRLDRATAFSLSPETAAKKKAEYEALLHQKTISRDTLRTLIRLADTREKAAIGVLTRQYRVQIFDRFWSRQDAYKERQAALTRVLAAWEAAGQSPARQEQMLVWLDEALKSVTSEADGPLPEDPNFDGDDSPEDDQPAPTEPDGKPATKKPASKEPATKKPAPKEPVEKPAAKKPQADGSKPAPPKTTEKPVEKPKADVPSKAPGPQPADTSLVPNRATGPGGPLRPSEDDEPPQPRVGEGNPLPPAGLPRPDTPAPHPAGSSVAEIGRAALTAALVDPSLAVPLPPESALLDELAGARPTLAYRPDARGVPQPPLQLVDVELAADALGGALPPAVAPQRHATANGRAYVGPLPDDPVRGLGRESVPPLGMLTDVQVPPEPLLPPVQVNVANLKARIAGCNLTLRELEIELDEQRDWDAASLAPLVERLRDLRQQRNDLAAIRELMPEAEQDRAGRFESLKLAVAQLGRRIFEARTRAGEDKSAATRRAELDRLDALSRELAKLAP